MPQTYMRAPSAAAQLDEGAARLSCTRTGGHPASGRRGTSTEAQECTRRAYPPSCDAGRVLLPALYDGRAAVDVAGGCLAGEALAGAVGAVARRVAGARRVGVVAAASVQTVVAVAGALSAGAAVVPVNPSAGEAERRHVLADAAPDVVLDQGDVDLAATAPLPSVPEVDESPAFVLYTSGTTGPPKGAVLPRRAVAVDLDGLADAWGWTADDVLVHGLPLFHVHGLVLGVLGPLRVGGALRHVGRFSPASYAAAGGSLYFGVPTMWSRLAADEPAARALRSARLLVSGSAALPAPVFDRIRAVSGHEVVERYGLTETLIVAAARHDRARHRGHVGGPLPGARAPPGGRRGRAGKCRGARVDRVQRLPQPPRRHRGGDDRDGWFRTGDLGAWGEDGQLRILGRAASDLVKTGGYKVGAGEVEDALLAHPAVAECAVTGEPDDDLGERIVAWVVTREPVAADVLAGHVAGRLAPHKRPREVRFVDALPRNEMGKVQKSRLGT